MKRTRGLEFVIYAQPVETKKSMYANKRYLNSDVDELIDLQE